jgi:ribonuclease HI
MTGTSRPAPRDLQVCWVNVGKSSPCHISALELAFEEGIDIICVQEPWTTTRSRTSNHPGYSLHSPVLNWGEEDDLEATRPRVLTYSLKGPTVASHIIHPRISRDLLWVQANGFMILNAYRAPGSDSTLTYVTQFTPAGPTLIGGDFNVWHEHFEPGVVSANGGTLLAQWATTHDLPYIGEPGIATQRSGHVIDLSFSNIPHAYTCVQPEMNCGSDHETLVTVIPGRGYTPAKIPTLRVPERRLPQFAGLVELGLLSIAGPQECRTPSELDHCISAFTTVITQAIETAGKVHTGAGRSAPWWTNECRRLHKEHRRTFVRGQVSPETRAFLAEVRRAKKAYWQDRIDNISDDQSLYQIIGWHKLSHNQQDAPILHQGRSLTGPLEKAEALREAILNRFTNEDDLPDSATEESAHAPSRLPWDTFVSTEEAERCAIGVSSTSPGTDRISVRLLKACWTSIHEFVRLIYQRCLQLSHFPAAWKLAEVAMIPKVGKKDRSSPRSWRPIALLSCLGKGLERLVARRIAYAALENDLLSPQHGGALPRRSAMDLVTAFTHDVEHAFAMKKHVTMVTMDVQGAFDALLKNRLLQRMRKQGWPRSLLAFVHSFLTDRHVQVRLGGTITPPKPVACGTPQGSPLSPILYTLYLAELLNQDRGLRFGYADDVCLYRATHSLDTNVRELASDIALINAWGDENKVFFAPEKQEMIHLTRKRDDYNPTCRLSDTVQIEPIPLAASRGQKPGLRWLGVWFDRKLTFQRHVTERSAIARKVAHHVRGLANTAHGPPPSALKKAVTTCILPALLYGAEAWYEGRRKNAGVGGRTARGVSTRVGWHLATVNKVIVTAARAVLPAWRTTPTAILLREAGLPSATVALEEVRLRFALHIQTTDKLHPLTDRTKIRRITRGKKVGESLQARSKVQRAYQILHENVPRTILVAPHYSPGSRQDPTRGVTKKDAATAFRNWWSRLPPSTLTVFSDGSEVYVDGERRVAYGYVVYSGQTKVAEGKGTLHPVSHVFDSEAVGAWRGLQHALHLPIQKAHIWMCIDSTSVIWCIRGDASKSSQWAFLRCQAAMEAHDIRIRWSPGHTGIEGNEAADTLAKQAAMKNDPPTGEATQPTVSGVRSIARKLLRATRELWWSEASAKLSERYQTWKLAYDTTKTPPELSLSRPTLARLLAIRTAHGDFEWYHKKFGHNEAKMHCSCGRPKTPEHLVHCPRTIVRFTQWPLRDVAPPTTALEGHTYISSLLSSPGDFAHMLELTSFYSRICTH